MTADYRPGDAVRTVYGVGVVVGVDSDRYAVRLWRTPGQSIGSCAVASLMASSVSRNERIFCPAKKDYPHNRFSYCPNCRLLRE